ncbi:hypothetical protein TBH_C2188 [Thiolapillus brandeum]|uniref:Uncharacterized protein n=1 Tax=Thiolapillus brandeum TaxID=1076588 RepID=A0A7U6JI28_9GAMM|nr:hypothetical protein TBH_C2188 [Thiolapillus brandeum]
MRALSSDQNHRTRENSGIACLLPDRMGTVPHPRTKIIPGSMWKTRPCSDRVELSISCDGNCQSRNGSAHSTCLHLDGDFPPRARISGLGGDFPSRTRDRRDYLEIFHPITMLYTGKEYMSKQYIYLDWNVIQYMKNETIIEEKSINGKEFKRLIKKLSKKYIFPYSEAHLRDLATRISQTSKQYIEEDLIFLKDISGDYVLGLDENENCIPIKGRKNIKRFFDEIVECINQENMQEPIIIFEENNSYNVDLNRIDDGNLFKELLVKNNGVLNNDVFKNFLMVMWKNIDNPSFYKKIRAHLSNLKKQFDNTENTIIDQQSNYFKEVLPFLEFLVEEDVAKIKNNFREIMNSFLQIDKRRKIENLTLGEKIELAYLLLDFNPNFREKINKKNRPTNMFRDIKNLFFASQARYYITEDYKTYTKSKIISEVLRLNVKIVKMSEFANKFC